MKGVVNRPPRPSLILERQSQLYPINVVRREGAVTQLNGDSWRREKIVGLELVATLYMS